MDLPPWNRAWPADLGPDVSLRLSQLEKQPPASLSAASQLRGTPGQRPPTPHCAHGTAARTFTEDPVCAALPSLDPCEGDTARSTVTGSAGLSRTRHVCRTHCVMNL